MIHYCIITLFGLVNALYQGKAKMLQTPVHCGWYWKKSIEDLSDVWQFNGCGWHKMMHFCEHVPGGICIKECVSTGYCIVGNIGGGEILADLVVWKTMPNLYLPKFWLTYVSSTYFIEYRVKMSLLRYFKIIYRWLLYYYTDIWVYSKSKEGWQSESTHEGSNGREESFSERPLQQLHGYWQQG